MIEKPSQQIRSLELDDGSPVPFMSTVFTHMENNPDKHAVLHVKAVAGSRLVDRARANGVLSQVSFMSSSTAHLDVASPYAHTVFLSFPAIDPADYQAYDAVAVALASVTVNDVAGRIRQAWSTGRLLLTTRTSGAPVQPAASTWW